VEFVSKKIEVEKEVYVKVNNINYRLKFGTLVVQKNIRVLLWHIIKGP
jgi:hypothetical protein